MSTVSTLNRSRGPEVSSPRAAPRFVRPQTVQATAVVFARMGMAAVVPEKRPTRRPTRAECEGVGALPWFVDGDCARGGVGAKSSGVPVNMSGPDPRSRPLRAVYNPPRALKSEGGGVRVRLVRCDQGRRVCGVVGAREGTPRLGDVDTPWSSETLGDVGWRVLLPSPFLSASGPLRRLWCKGRLEASRGLSLKRRKGAKIWRLLQALEERTGLTKSRDPGIPNFKWRFTLRTRR